MPGKEEGRIRAACLGREGRRGGRSLRLGDGDWGPPGSVQGTCPSFPLTWANWERKARLSNLPGWHGGDGDHRGKMPDPVQPCGPPLSSLPPPPPLPPRSQLRARARVGGKNSAAATARPGGERPRSARRTTSGIGTSQNSWGRGHAATPLPQPGTFLAPRGGSFEAAVFARLQPPPQPPTPGTVGAPWDPPNFGAGSAARWVGGDTCSQDFRDSFTASPSSPEPGGSLLPLLLPLHHPIRQRSSPSGWGGKRLQPGTGSSRGVTRRPGGSPRAPGEQRGGGQGLRLPPAAALSPAPLPRAPPHHHAFFLLFLLLQVSHGEPS